MNRNHLALFSAVAQAGGISQGAALVRISQPAVSKQIAELESALGVKLLERRPRGCRLTEAGEILAEHARRWLATEQAATRAIAEYRGLQRGCLRIGASLTIGGYLLPKIVAAFHRACPELELQLEIANSDRIHALLAEAAIEIGFTEGPLVNADLATHCFHEDELVGVAPAGHRFLKLPGITVREFVREPLLLREVGSGTRAVVELALRRKGITVRPLLSLASPEAIKHLVVQGVGVAFVSRLIITAELASGQLGIVPLKDLHLKRPLHWQNRRDRALSPAAARFLTYLTSAPVKRP